MIPLVLLHAYPVDSRMWDPLRAALPSDVAERVLTPDQRGLGKAALPRDGGAASLDAVADDVVALLDEHGVERAVVGGCSMGGYATMALLRRAPERVAGVVLIGTRPDADPDERQVTRRADADRAEAEGIGWLADAVLPMLIAGGTPDLQLDLTGRLRAVITTQPPAGVAWAQRAMAARPDSSADLGAFEGPALVIAGERDVICPVDVMRRMAGLLRGGEFVEVPGAGHLSPVDAPHEVAAAITSWLGRTID